MLDSGRKVCAGRTRSSQLEQTGAKLPTRGVQEHGLGMWAKRQSEGQNIGERWFRQA